MEKIYHVYLRDQCIYSSLTEEKFKETWSNLINMVGLMKTEYNENELSYEECVVNRGDIHNSSY